VGWQNLDGDGAVKTGIACAIHFTHSACASRSENLKMAEAKTCSESHLAKHYILRKVTELV